MESEAEEEQEKREQKKKAQKRKMQVAKEPQRNVEGKGVKKKEQGWGTARRKATSKPKGSAKEETGPVAAGGTGDCARSC